MSANGNEKLLRYLDSVTSASFRARNLVRQILNFSRKDDVKKELINIRPLILESIEFIRASLPGNYLEIIVSDTGIGIPRTIMDRILSRFLPQRFGGRGPVWGCQRCMVF